MAVNMDEKSYQPLRLSTLSPNTGYARPFFFSQNPVRISSSALEVMTDLRFVPAATIHADVDIATTTQKMIARGVRSLLVVDASSDVVGLITASDLLGDRPLEVVNALDIEFDEIKVTQIMTIAADIEVIPMEDVLLAHVGDIVETLKHSGRQHALVVEVEPFTEKAMIRGVFSASQIARQLGVVQGRHDLSQTFAEIEQAVTGHKQG